MKPFRVRVKQLPFGNYAVEKRQWPWSFWREHRKPEWRSLSKEEAIRRAVYLLKQPIIPHADIVEKARG